MRDKYHFYHAYVNGDPDVWGRIVAEHFTHMRSSGLLEKLEEPTKIGIVGPHAMRKALLHLLDKLEVDVWIVAVNQEGWEQTTLYPMWAWAKEVPGAAVLYAHTKGAANPSERQHEWRRQMQRLLVDHWRECTPPMEIVMDVDVVGAFRFVNDGVAYQFAGDGADEVLAQLNRECGTDFETTPAFPEVGEAIFAGNYWWATTDWIGTKQSPRMRSRYDAETWIGGANSTGREPTVSNVKASWYL